MRLCVYVAAGFLSTQMIQAQYHVDHDDVAGYLCMFVYVYTHMEQHANTV
jgi:hypothetical protein